MDPVKKRKWTVILWVEKPVLRRNYRVQPENIWYLLQVPCRQNNPQVAIYVVVDEANSEDQAHSYYAQSIAREILKEALPYLGIYPDEELTGVNEGVGITGEGIQVEQTPESMDSEVPDRGNPQSAEGEPSGQ